MTRLLITGASGLLGANLVVQTERSYEVMAVVNKHVLEFTSAQVIQADLTEANSVRKLFEANRPDWIIHCAADIAIDDIETEPERANRLNVAMSREVAKVAASIGSQLIYVSTDSVFDGLNGPYKETDIPHPLNVYARRKLEGERATIEEHPEALIVRTNLFGWCPVAKRTLAEWFYAKLSAGERCLGFSDIYFSPIYASDLAQIFIRMLEHGLEGLYHVPGTECISKYEFGRRLAAAFGFNPELVVNTTSERMGWKAERPKKTCLDGTKISWDLGSELPSLEAGLTRFRADHEKGLFNELQARSMLTGGF